MPSDTVMHRWKHGTLRSGSKRGPKVKNRKQAVAIMLSERRAEKAGKLDSGRKKRSRKRSRS